MNRMEHLLVCLGEEANEVAHMVSKTLRFGGDDKYPEQGLLNSERLEEELIDLFAVATMLRDAGFALDLDFGKHSTMTAIEAKRRKVEKFLAYAKERGTLT